MANLYLANRLDALRRAQNPDGGWSYYAGKQNSWLEPTVYAALALHGDPASEKAWNLVRSWQRGDGSWRVAGNVPDANWTTSLGTLLAVAKGAPASGGVKWLDKSFLGQGWAWKDENAPSVEPTAWSVLALAKAAGRQEAMAGARAFLAAQPVIAGTCGLVMAAVPELPDLKAVAAKWVTEARSAEARAKLTLGLRLQGMDVAENEAAPLPKNLAVLALEALAARDGRFELLKTEAA